MRAVPSGARGNNRESSNGRAARGALRGGCTQRTACALVIPTAKPAASWPVACPAAPRTPTAANTPTWHYGTPGLYAMVPRALVEPWHALHSPRCPSSTCRLAWPHFTWLLESNSGLGYLYTGIPTPSSPPLLAKRHAQKRNWATPSGCARARRHGRHSSMHAATQPRRAYFSQQVLYWRNWGGRMGPGPRDWDVSSVLVLDTCP